MVELAWQRTLDLQEETLRLLLAKLRTTTSPASYHHALLTHLQLTRALLRARARDPRLAHISDRQTHSDTRMALTIVPKPRPARAVRRRKAS